MSVFRYDTHIGKLGIVVAEQKLTHILWDGEAHPKGVEVGETELHLVVAAQLAEYFAGERKEFDLPLAPRGTEFQMGVWEALKGIPYGETRSYQDIAITIGNPKACRAVGAANGRNPIPIIIPCHRVIGKNDGLVGFGGGLGIKSHLLGLERGMQK